MQTKADENTVRWVQMLTEKLGDPNFVDALNKLLGIDQAPDEPVVLEEPTSQPVTPDG